MKFYIEKYYYATIDRISYFITFKSGFTPGTTFQSGMIPEKVKGFFKTEREALEFVVDFLDN